MRIERYSEWVGGYCATFGFDRETDVKMVLAWEIVFVSARYTAEELRMATTEIAMNPPKWRSDHLLAIHAAIRGIRMRKWRAIRVAEEAESPEKACIFCERTGWVIVPHPRCWTDGEWSASATGTFYTATVSCRCFSGRRFVDQVLAISSAEREKKRILLPMSLESYERKFPHWQAEMAKRNAAEKAGRAAHTEAVFADELFGPLLAKIAGKLGMK